MSITVPPAAPEATAGTVPVPFSAQLREATRGEHGRAESRGFITRLMGGELAESDYWRLLSQYLPVYTALEAAVRTVAASDPVLAGVDDPRLDRAPTIRADLSARFGPGHAVDPPSAATQRYVERIREAGPDELLAHHYLRYLGDLSGGQAIGALVARHYGIPAGQLTMWDFRAIGAPKRVKDRYREQLDLVVDPARRERVVEEARVGFALAAGLFDDLDRAARSDR